MPSLRKFLLILSVFLLVTSFSAKACLVASQERIFPIGTIQDDLIGLEIIGQRYGKGDFGSEVFWQYSTSVIRYNQNHDEKVVNTLKIKVEVAYLELDSFLKSQLDTAIYLCGKMDDFIFLRPNELSFCDFQSNCTKVQLIKNDTILKFKVKKYDSIFEVKYLTKAYEGQMAKKYLEEYYSYSGYIDSVGFNLYVSSIRLYKNERFNLVIFHLGRGQDFADVTTGKIPPKKEYHYEMPITDLENFVFKEPLMHHGKGFDYFVLLSN